MEYALFEGALLFLEKYWYFLVLIFILFFFLKRKTVTYMDMNYRTRTQEKTKESSFRGKMLEKREILGSPQKDEFIKQMKKIFLEERGVYDFVQKIEEEVKSGRGGILLGEIKNWIPSDKKSKEDKIFLFLLWFCFFMIIFSGHLFLILLGVLLYKYHSQKNKKKE